MGKTGLKFSPIKGEKTKHWTSEVINFCDAMNGKSFIWNERDCFSLICSVVDVMFKTDYYNEQLKHKRGARSSIKFFHQDEVLKSLEEIGYKESKKNSAQAGDVYYEKDKNGRENTAINLYDCVMMANEKDGIFIVKKNFLSKNVKVMTI